jgi:hypothetical protein
VEKSTPRERPRHLLGLRPRQLLRATCGPPHALRAPTLHPPGVSLRCTPRASRSPTNRAPPEGGRWPPLHHYPRATNKPPKFTALSHPPLPFPLGRGASRPLSSDVQAARRFACFSCPPAVERVAFQERQGFASPSGVARVLAFGCGPRQPPLRPLTPFPLRGRLRVRKIKHGKHPGIDPRSVVTTGLQ